jgi:predicted nucleic acid-binding protein
LSFLVDTNVISEIQKGARCDQSVMAWWNSIEMSELYLSVMVAGEISRGIEKLMNSDPNRARIYRTWLGSVIQALDGRILDVELETAELWGKLTSRRSKPLVDTLLAATALTHNLTLVTRNTRDIQETGVRYLNPFQPGPQKGTDSP